MPYDAPVSSPKDSDIPPLNTEVEQALAQAVLIWAMDSDDQVWDAAVHLSRSLVPDFVNVRAAGGNSVIAGGGACPAPGGAHAKEVVIGSVG